MKRYAVLGAGSLGMLLAGRLAASGCTPALWTRTEEQALLLRESGLTVEDAATGEALRAAVYAEALSAVRPGYDGTVLIAVKQTAFMPQLLDGLAETLSTDASVVCFQNGIGHLEKLAEVLPGRRLAAAVTTEGALRTGPASVRHTGRGETWIGRWGTNPLGADGWPEPIGQMLQQAGFSVFMSNDIRERMLRKLLINAVINPLTALWRVPNGELPGTPERRAVMEGLFRETADILEAWGWNGPGRDEMWKQVLAVCEATAGNRSSMLQDVLAGRETEIDALNGAVSRMAQSSGMQAPWNAAATSLVKGILSSKELRP